MEPEQYQQVKEIFQSVLEAPADQRARLLDEKCGQERSVRAEVERLIESYDSTYLDRPAVEGLAETIADHGLRPGHAFGHYTILSKIGSGGMGEVYLAEDGKLGRRVAIKLLPDIFTGDPDRLSRFQQEARAASALNHPNILTIYEIGEAAGKQYIATEYINGETLRARLNQGWLSVMEALDISVQCASALAAAHDEGIIHRDIKPENIMLRRDNLVKVLDFGLAKLIEKKKVPVGSDGPTDRHIRTAPGMIMGTVQYMSPEQARGHATDARSDIWSLGCVMYEMLTGQPPFSGETSADMIVEIMKKRPACVSRFVSELPDGLDGIVAKTTEKNPDERYQTVEDLLIDLQRLRRRLDIQSGEHEPMDPRQDIGSMQYVRRPVRSGQSDRPTTDYPAYVSMDNRPPQITGARYRRFLSLSTVLMIGLAGIVLLTLVSFKLWQLREENDGSNPAEAPPVDLRSLFEGAPERQLTDSENGVISPDGKLVVYSRVLNDKHTLWTRQLATGRSIQIGGPVEKGYGSMAFSSDSQFIFYALPALQGQSQFGLHRISVLGGHPTQLASGTNGVLAVSPDDSQIVYVRSDSELGTCTLFTASTDGSGERAVNTRQRPRCYGQLAWGGPDARFVISAVGQSDTANANIELVKVLLDDGKESLFSKHKWVALRRLVWHPDKSSLLVTGRKENASELLNIWQLETTRDKLTKVTDDSVNHEQLSITADARTALVRRVVLESHLYVSPADSPVSAKRLSQAAGRAAWLSDDRLVYGSYKSQTLWTINADGNVPEEIGAEYDKAANSSPDGRYIVTMSAQSGVSNIWRMNSDGSNRMQITNGPGEQYPTVSPDNQWIYYHTVGTEAPAIFKVPIDGGDPIQVVSAPARDPSISPDGQYLAYFGRMSERARELMVLHLETGEIAAKFDLTDSESTRRICWEKDAGTLYYATETPGLVGNIYRQRLDGGKPQRITDFATDRIFDFAFSPDYKQVALVRGKWKSEMVLLNLAAD